MSARCEYPIARYDSRFNQRYQEQQMLSRFPTMESLSAFILHPSSMKGFIGSTVRNTVFHEISRKIDSHIVPGHGIEDKKQRVVEVEAEGGYNIPGG